MGADIYNNTVTGIVTKEKVATTTSGTGAVASTGVLSTGYKNNDISSSAVSVEALTKTLNTYMRMGAYWTAMGENKDVLMALYNKSFNLKDVYIGTYQDSTSKADNKTCFTFGMRYRPATTNKDGFPVRKGMKGSIFSLEGDSVDKTIFLQYTKGATGHSEGVVDKPFKYENYKSSRAIEWKDGDYCATGYGLGATPSQTALLGFYHSFGAYGQLMIGWLYSKNRNASFQKKYVPIFKATLKESHVAAMTMLSWQYGDWYDTGASNTIKDPKKITNLVEVKVNLWNCITAHLESIYLKKPKEDQDNKLKKVETAFMMFAYNGYNQTGEPKYTSLHEKNRRMREFKIYCGQASDLTNMVIPDEYNKGIFAGAEELSAEEFKAQTYTVAMESKEELDRMAAEYNFVAGDDGVAATKYRNAVINAMSEKDEAKRNAALDAAADEYSKSITKTSSTNAKAKTVQGTSTAMAEDSDIKYDWFNDTGVYYGMMAKSGDTNIKNKNLNRRYHYDKFKKYPTATEWDASQLKQAKVFFVRPDMNLYPNNGPNPEVEDITLAHNIVIDSDVAKYLDASYGTEKSVAGIKQEDKTFKTYFIPILTNQFLETSLLDAKMAFVKSSANVKGVDVSVGRYDSTDTSDTELSFTFNVDNYNSVYRLIDVWFKYVQAIGEGTISPKPENSIHNRLDYTSTVYGFLLGADGLTINHWYASIGIIPSANLSNTFVYKSSGENVKEIQVPFMTNTPIENRKLETINEFNYLQSKPYDASEEDDIKTFVLNYNKIEYIISDNMIRDDWYAESFRIVFDLDLEVFKLIPIPTIELVRKYIKLANISDDKVFDKGKDYNTLDAIKEMFKGYKASGDKSVISDYFAEEFIVRSRALNDKGNSLAVSKKGTVPIDGSYSRLSKMMNNEGEILLGDEQFTKETKEKTDRVMAHLSKDDISKDDKRDVKKNLTYEMMLGIESDNRALADITFANLSDLKKSDSPLSKRIKGNMETEYVSFADNPLIEAIPEGKNSIESIGRNHIKIGSDSLALTKDKNFLIDFLRLERMDIIQKGVKPYNTYDGNNKIKDTTWGTNSTFLNPHIDTKNRNTIDESKALSYIKANNLSDGSDKNRVSILYGNSSGRTDFGMFDDNARQDDSTHIMGQIWKVRKIGARASTPLDILTSVISKIDKTDISSLKLINQPINNSDNSVSFAKDSRNPFRTTDVKDGVSIIDLLELKSNTVVQLLNKQPDANSSGAKMVPKYESYSSGMTEIIDKSLVGNDSTIHEFTSGHFDFTNKQQKLNDSTDKANDPLKDGVIYISKQLKDNLNEAQLLISSKQRDIKTVLNTMQKITTNYFEDSYATITEGTPAQYDKYGAQTKAATPATRVEKNKFISGSSGRIDPAVYKDPYLFSSDKTLFSIQDPNIKSKKNTTVLSALKNLYNADGSMNELANTASKGLRTGYNYKFAEDFTSMSFADFELGADHRNNLVNTGVFNTNIDSNSMTLPDTIPAETFDYKSILGADIVTDKGADVYFNSLALKVGLSSYAMERIISVDARTNNDKHDDYKFNTKNTTMNPDFEVALNNNKVFISVNPKTGELVADVQAVLEPSKKDKLLGYTEDAIKSFGTNAVMNFAAKATNRIFYNDADIRFKTKGTFYEEEPINPEYDIKPLENIIVDTSKDEFVKEDIPKYHELQELLSEAQNNINKANETTSAYTPDVHETFVDIIEKSKENWINTQQYKENYNPSLPNVPELINTEELSKIVLGNEDSILKNLNKDILKSTTALEETQLLNITKDKLNNENIHVNLFGDTLFNLKQETYLREQHNADYIKRFYNDDSTPIDPIYNEYLASVAPSFKALMNMNLSIVKKDELEEVPISYSEVNPEFLMLAGRLSKMEILYENSSIPDSESKFSALSSKLDKIDKSFDYGRENYDPNIPDSKPTLNALLKLFKVL